MKQLKNGENAIERRIGGAAAPESSAAGDAEFETLVTELAELIEQDKLPEGFDLNKAAGDAALVELMHEYGAAARVRIYAAEQRAEEAEDSAMRRVSEQVRARGALPKISRGGGAAPGATNYRGMSSEAFRDLLTQMKKTARDGGKTRL